MSVLSTTGLLPNRRWASWSHFIEMPLAVSNRYQTLYGKALWEDGRNGTEKKYSGTILKVNGIKMCVPGSQAYRTVTWAEMASVNQGSFERFCWVMTKCGLEYTLGHAVTGKRKMELQQDAWGESDKSSLDLGFSRDVRWRFYSQQNSLKTMWSNFKLLNFLWMATTFLYLSY